MSRVLPILFNTEMVRAILDGRKTVTRRMIKYPPHPDMPDNHDYCQMPLWMRIEKDEYGFRTLHYMDVIEQEPFRQTRYFESLGPYEKGDILYVRETWGISNFDCDRNVAYIVYKASKNEKDEGCRAVKFPDDKFENYYDSMSENSPEWRPSIHMPKEAARIWIKVMDVRVERLQDITEEQAEKEGGIDNRGFINSPENEYNNLHTAKEHFMQIWNSTIKKSDLDRYGWDANPWVWVIEFEQCEKPEPCILKGIEPAEDKRPCIGYSLSESDETLRDVQRM